MKIMIKSNPREPQALNRFAVFKNNVLVKAHLTIQEAEALQKRLKEKKKKGEIL
jgi:hypothetical protein